MPITPAAATNHASRNGARERADERSRPNSAPPNAASTTGIQVARSCEASLSAWCAET